MPIMVSVMDVASRLTQQIEPKPPAERMGMFPETK